jgi:hypothetical protein
METDTSEARLAPDQAVSQIAAEADDRGAQLALAVEMPADEVEGVLRAVPELRALVAKQRATRPVLVVRAVLEAAQVAA